MPADAEPRETPDLLRLARFVVVVVLHVLASFGVQGAEAAAAMTRSLPATLWRRSPTVFARRRGLYMELDLRDNVQRTFYFTGWYERRYVSLLMREAKAGDVYVDVGAHVGIHALLMARRFEELGTGRVLAFEAAPDLASRLSDAASRNRLVNIEVFNMGLGESRGVLELRSDPERWDAADAAVRSRVGPGPVVARARVESFDTWAQEARIDRVDIIKIDVEGDELTVLRGMTSALGRHRPRLIGVEIREYILKRAGGSAAEVRRALATAGYEPVPTPDLEGNFLFAPSR